MKRTLIWTFVACCLLGPSNSVWACNIPVFRYALENWQPDPYSIFVLHQGELNGEQESLLTQLQSNSLDLLNTSNARFFAVDTRSLEAGNEQDLGLPLGSVDYLRRWIEHTPTDAPSIVALFPDHPPQSLPAWHGEFNAKNLNTLFDSPIRQEIIQRILAGQSAVWVLIESGNAEADDAAFHQLETLLTDAPNHVNLPDQELIETDDEFNADNEIELKVAFSALRLSRDSVEEAAIVSMLLGSEEDLRDFNEPIAIPVYGRGRTYYALIGKGINADTVNDNCQFLCGACSCQIKQDNPGIDLMMAMNWQDQITGSAMNDVPLPELTGIGGFEVDAQDSDTPTEVPANEVAVASTTGTEPTEMTLDSSVESPVTLPIADAIDETDGLFRRRLFLWLIGLLAIGLIFAVGSTLMVKRGTATR